MVALKIIFILILIQLMKSKYISINMLSKYMQSQKWKYISKFGIDSNQATYRMRVKFTDIPKNIQN